MSTLADRVHDLRPRDISSLTHAVIICGQSVKKENPHKSLILVSGKVTGSNAEETKRNEQRLIQKTERLQRRNPKNIYITSGQIMIPEIRAALAPSNPQYHEFITMWDQIASSIVDKVIMTEKWRNSTGARREHQAALKRGIPIMYERPLSKKIHAITVPLRRKIQSLKRSVIY